VGHEEGLGEADASRDLFRDVFAARQRTLGPNHADTLAAWFGIAREMAAGGDHAGAEDEFRDLLPHLERRLGPDHPDTLAAAEWIDYMRGRKGDRSPQPR